ncbi:MAG: LruC domain-containing protein [Bacteroidia bacterium]
MKNIFMLAALSLLIMASCKKNLVPSESAKTADLEKNVKSIHEMIIPKGFKFASYKQLNLTVNPDITMSAGETRLVSLYDGNPRGEGRLYGNYLLKKESPLNIKITIATATETIYAVVKSPNGSSASYIISSTGNSASLNIGALQKSGKKLYKSIPVAPNCSVGCTSTASGSNQNLNLNNSSDVVCISGSFSGNININRGTVRICGRAAISNISINNDGVLLISTSAEVEIDNFNLNTSTTVFKNWSASTKIKGNFSPNGIVNNYSKLEIGGDLNINGASNFVNDGELKVDGDINNNKNFTNNGSLEIGRSFSLNGGANTINNCYIKVGRDFTLNNLINNNSGEIIVSNTTTINGGGVLNLNDAAVLYTKDLMVNNIIAGSGTTSFLKAEGNTTINGGGKFNGNFSFCDPSGIETNWGTISNTVTQDCKTYIAKSECIKDGNGEEPKSKDSDEDGVEDELDEYPEDKSRAFNNYYPNESGFVTVAYEDLWPSKGDYDLNDCVVDFRYNMITNPKNEVIRIEAEYVLRASGGSQAIAFCHNFPIKASNIESVNGAKLEEKNETAVFTIFTDSKAELGAWNTVPTQAKAKPVSYNVNITLKEPVSLESIVIGEFDPFIWVNEKDKGRAYEIHLPGKSVTSYADKKLFGYADDNSNDGENNYLTKAGLPWAILVPEKFEYCAELKTFDKKEITDITQVYLHFAQWAQSGGKYFPDWYKNEKGYRESNYIFVE